MRLIVIGAGIGGLTAALTLLREGFEVTVLEQAPQFREIGAGLQISSNGTSVLRELKLDEALASVAIRPKSIDFKELETGNLLYRTPLGDAAAARYGASFYQIHRADLLQVIADAVPTRIVRLDARVNGVRQDSAGVDVELASGETLRADAVIGADGIHSSIRELLWGEDKTHSMNRLLWRVLIPAAHIKHLQLEENCHIWTGAGRVVVAYWVRRGELFNFAASVPSDEVHRESYSMSGDISELRASFEAAEPRLEQLINSVDSAFITGLNYRDPLESWSKGRISLLGDAAHAMAPWLAQGACASMEDAWVLARCLARSRDDIPSAFVEYENRRRPRTMRVQAAARAMAKQVHETEPLAIRARNGRLKGMSRIDPLSETVWGWLYEYNPVKEAEKPGELVVGLSSTYEGKKMLRPESQRAFDLWRSAFSSDDVSEGIDGLRAAYERFLLTHCPLTVSASLREIDSNGVRGIFVTPQGANLSRVLLHFHGGGYVIGSAKSSLDLAARLAETVNGRCFTVDYRLAPENPYPAALEDAVAAYRWILSQGVSADDVFISGESAGGGLALALVLALKESGDPLPRGVIAMSPWTDLTGAGPSIDAYSGHDPAANRNIITLFAGSYFQSHEPTDPRVSPLFGDFTHFPRLLIQAVRGEVMESDATRLAERARRMGVDVSIKLFDDTVHIFPIFSFLPETKIALEQIRSFTKDKMLVV